MQCCSSDWKQKILATLKECKIVDSGRETMTGRITLNLHEGKPVDCIVEPYIRYK